MKKTIGLMIASAILYLSGYTQANNPYDAEGISAVRNALYMQKEMKEKRFTTPDKALIEKYNNELKLGTLSTVTDITTKTFDVVSKPGFNLNAFIANSTLPSPVKNEFLAITGAAVTYNVDAYKNFLTRKVDSILKVSTLNNNDKLMILKMCSLYYHLPEIQTKNSNNNNQGPFYRNGDPNSSTILGCMGAGFAIGYTVGSAFGAGALGGAIGAGVGLIVGVCIEIS